jgi:hypothetical protein
MFKVLDPASDMKVSRASVCVPCTAVVLVEISYVID